MQGLPDRWRADLVRDYRYPPLCLTWRTLPANPRGGDVELLARSEGADARFLGLYVREATPRRLAEAGENIASLAGQEGALPLLIAPYLPEERLLELETRALSALDLSGNGTLKAPGAFSVFRTGFPNRFTASRPLKNAYRGASSMVARAFLLRPAYDTVNELAEEIARRGGEVSLSTISKALTEISDDLLIERKRQARTPQARALRLLDPERLLQRLEENYAAPKVRRIFTGKSEMDALTLQMVLQARAREAGMPLIATGLGSATRYAALAMEKTLYLYTHSIDTLLDGLPVIETNRFPNLNICETDDTTVYFDPRLEQNGFPWASPVTAYLEMAQGETRLRESARQVKERILSDVQEKLR